MKIYYTRDALQKWHLIFNVLCMTRTVSQTLEKPIGQNFATEAFVSYQIDNS